MPRRIPTATVVSLDLDDPLGPLTVDGRHDRVLLVVRRGRHIVGQLDVPSNGASTVEVRHDTILQEVADDLWRAELERLLLAAVAVDAHTVPEPPVTVIVCTRDRPIDLQRCLESITHLDPPPLEVIVVDSAPTTREARNVCERFNVAYLLEPEIGQSRARNRGVAAAAGEVVAFTDDDCVVDPGWLAGLGVEFADPRITAVTGVVAPLELETHAQWLFEAHGGHRRGFSRRVADGAYVNAIMSVGRLGVGANVAFRRSAFDRLGPFREWLGPGTPARAADDYDLFCRILAAGDKVVYDPTRLVWHRHRSDLIALSRTLGDYGRSSSALATQRVVIDGDLSALRVLQWWWLDHVPGDIRRSLVRADDRIPLRYTIGELAGTLAGPLALLRSRHSRRAIRPVELPRDTREHTQPSPWRGRGPLASVVVVSAGRARSLERLARALATQTYPAAATEVVVVLDGGIDDSAQRLRALDLPYCLVVEERARSGVAAARNAGLALATGEVVIFLDDDVVPAPDCLAVHVDAYLRGDADIVLGYAPPVVAGDWWSLVVRAWWEDHFACKADSTRTLRWGDVVTLNSSFPAAVLDSLGGFDEAFDRRHEDWELGIRALQSGLRARYEPRAVAHHHLDGTLRGALLRQRDEARADVQLARKHPAVARDLALAAHLDRVPVVERVPDGRSLDRAARLERRGRRGAWRNLTAALMRNAYTAGLQDELPTDAEYRAFRAAVDAVAPQPVTVALDGGPVPHVPSVGAVELRFTLAGEEVCRIDPGRPGESWSWRTILDRVERRPPAGLRDAILGRIQRELDETNRELAHVE